MRPDVGLYTARSTRHEAPPHPGARASPQLSHGRGFHSEPAWLNLGISRRMRFDLGQLAVSNAVTGHGLYFLQTLLQSDGNPNLM